MAAMLLRLPSLKIERDATSTAIATLGDPFIMKHG